MRWLLWMMAAVAAAPQTGGVLRVQVSDAENLPIPGASVTLTCSSAANPIAPVVTDAEGHAMFEGLAPGPCQLDVTRDGFNAVILADVSIASNRAATMHVALQAGAGEEVTVEGKQQAIVVESTTRGEVLNREFTSRVPAGRSYQTGVQMAPGTGGNPNIAGGATNENVYGGPEPVTDYGVHDVQMAASDHLATFAVDVDTGSYSRSRRWLREQHRLPQAAGVRVEEFVNAFRYDYTANPDASRPLGVRLEATPHPWNDRMVIVRAALEGYSPPERTRPPAKLTFLVDVSGSMSSADKLGLAQQSLHLLVDNMGPEDQVAIATYAGAVRQVLAPTYTNRPQDIHAAIDALTSGGGTAMNDGMSLAYEMAESMFVEGAENRVIVLSDGDANIGRSSHEQILESLGEWAGKGITLSTIGFGTGNYRDTMMEQLANNGDGTYHYIDGPQEAKRVFGTEVAGTLTTIARDAKVQLEFPPDAVLAWRQIGYENREIADEDFRDDAVDAGEVGSGHQVTALFEVQLRDDPGPVLARMHVRAKPPGAEADASEWTGSLATDEVVADFGTASQPTRLAFGIATFAEKLRGSPFVEEVSWAALQDLLGGAVQDVPMHHELIELVGKARELDEFNTRRSMR